MTIEWNEVTWYSKLLAVILLFVVFCIGYNLGRYAADISLNTYALLSYVEPNKVNNNVVDLSQIYSSKAVGFSIHYPSGFAVDENYKYQSLGPGKDIPGVKFTIPATMSVGTNLSSDSYISIEHLPAGHPSCSAAVFLSPGATVKDIYENDSILSPISLGYVSDAAAGNRYEETVYAFSAPSANLCFAVRYFIHYGVFENYPPGTIKQFDRQKLLYVFDHIRRSLVLP